MVSQPRNYSPISAVSRAMALLELLADRPEGIGVVDAAATLEVEVSVISRLLATLEAEGYVRRHPANDRHVLGFRTTALALRHASRVDIASTALPYLQALARETRELTQMAIVDGDVLRFIARAQSDQPIAHIGFLGHTVRLSTMAAGRAWLAWLPDERVTALLAADAGSAPVVVPPPSLERLARELKQVRKAGFSVAVDEFDYAAAIAAPVWAGFPRQVVATVSISGPAFRLPAERLREFAPALLQCTEAISQTWPDVLLRQTFAADHDPREEMAQG